MVSINKTRLERTISSLGLIGYVEGQGVDRPAYSPNYRKARDLVEQLMIQAGMETRTDAVDNLFGYLPGRDAGGKTILLGSHLDAVPGGGIYDGALGVVAAIEAVQAIRESGTELNLGLEVVAFTAEEGGDLGGTFGSRSFVGLAADKSKPEILAQYDLTTADIVNSCGQLDRYCAYLEFHIEQGPVLWKKQIPVGIPTAIASITRYNVTVAGEANHAGTTPMDQRDDAMRTAAALMTEWYNFCCNQNDFVSNIGVLSISPGSPTIVPEKVEFILEIRSTEPDTTKYAVDTFQNILTSHCSGKGAMTLIIDKPPVKLDSGLIETIADVCAAAKIDHLKMPSGASHDASPISHFIPTGMIFVPSVKGVSHSRTEYTPHEDICVGTEVMVKTILRLDQKHNS